MIYLTRPAAETHKTVPKTLDKPVKKTFIDEDVSRQASSNYTLEDHREIRKEEVKAAVSDANDIINIYNNNNQFKFELHERTNRIMVKLINKDTDEIVREIPSEKMLDVVGSIWDLVGILVDERG